MNIEALIPGKYYWVSGQGYMKFVVSYRAYERAMFTHYALFEIPGALEGTWKVHKRKVFSSEEEEILHHLKGNHE